MQPKADLVTLTNNKEQIEKLLFELVLNPRIKAIEWSKITKQTPNIKIGYPGQHLASLITGMGLCCVNRNRVVLPLSPDGFMPRVP